MQRKISTNKNILNKHNTCYKLLTLVEYLYDIGNIAKLVYILYLYTCMY